MATAPFSTSPSGQIVKRFPNVHWLTSMAAQKQAVCCKESQGRIQGQGQARQYMFTLPRHLQTAAFNLRAHNEPSIRQAKLARTTQYEMFRIHEARREFCLLTERVQTSTKEPSTISGIRESLSPAATTRPGVDKAKQRARESALRQRRSVLRLAAILFRMVFM